MEDPQVLDRMRSDWNQRASEDAYYYVAFGRREQARSSLELTVGGKGHPKGVHRPPVVYRNHVGSSVASQKEAVYRQQTSRFLARSGGTQMLAFL